MPDRTCRSPCRVDPRSSRWRRRWLELAALGTLALAVLLAGQALRSGAPAPALAAAAALLPGVAALRAGQRPAAPGSIELDAAGRTWLAGARGGQGRLRPLVLLPWLIAYRSRTGILAVWRDAVPAASYRRLAVMARWAG